MQLAMASPIRVPVKAPDAGSRSREAARSDLASEAPGWRQAEDARSARHNPPFPPPSETEEEPLVLMVGMDACKAHAGKRWRDVKVALVAPLGPEKRVDTKTGRVSFVLGPRTYGAGIEDADRFYDRVMVLARRAGWHPKRRLKVVLLRDGALGSGRVALASAPKASR